MATGNDKLAFPFPLLLFLFCDVLLGMIGGRLFCFAFFWSNKDSKIPAFEAAGRFPCNEGDRKQQNEVGTWLVVVMAMNRKTCKPSVTITVSDAKALVTRPGRLA